MYHNSRKLPTGETLLPTSGLPVLADAALHGLAGEIVQVLASDIEAHPVALLGALLIAFGCATGRNAYILAGGRRHFLSGYFVIVGRSSRARKSTAIGVISDIFKHAGILPPTATGLSSGEGLIETIRDAKRRTNRDDEDDDDDLGVKDKRVLIMEEEFARPLIAMRRPGNNLSTILRLGFDGKPWSSLTSQRPPAKPEA